MLDSFDAVARRPPNPPALLTIRDAARILGVSLPTLRRWDASGKLRAGRHPCSNFRVYREADVLRLRRRIDASVKAA